MDYFVQWNACTIKYFLSKTYDTRNYSKVPDDTNNNNIDNIMIVIH